MCFYPCRSRIPNQPGYDRILYQYVPYSVGESRSGFDNDVLCRTLSVCVCFVSCTVA